MLLALYIIPNSSLSDAVIDNILNMLEGAYAENTLQAYASDMRVFAGFLGSKVPPLPASPEVIADYIAALAEQRKSFATIKRHIASLSAMHRFGGFEDPTKAMGVKLALRRAGRQLGSAQRQVEPINKPLLDRMLATCKDDILGMRDKVILLLAYETARRRSELTSFLIEDLISEGDKITGIILRKSKTDPLGTGKCRATITLAG
jgi:site-specific recombinase XerD